MLGPPLVQRPGCHEYSQTASSPWIRVSVERVCYTQMSQFLNWDEDLLSKTKAIPWPSLCPVLLPRIGDR